MKIKCIVKPKSKITKLEKIAQGEYKVYLNVPPLMVKRKINRNSYVRI
ncbi:MAG: hypothetical protein KatS3mg034_1281 [Vicingaceae bacterium]|nr:MAG: hypothetical protein KatS3mg034_1281 [Vicingaceae bacterium]